MHTKPWTPYLLLIVALLTTHCGDTETTSDESASNSQAEIDAFTDDGGGTRHSSASDVLDAEQDIATLGNDTQSTGIDTEPLDAFTPSSDVIEEMDVPTVEDHGGGPSTEDAQGDTSDALVYEDSDAFGPQVDGQQSDTDNDIANPSDISEHDDALIEEDPALPCENDEDCPESPACQVAICDIQDGICTTESIEDGTDCDDDNACNLEDICAAGVCVGQKAYPCEDQNECTDDSCDPNLGCVHKQNLATCEDGDPCTSDDTCEGGFCVGLLPTCDDLNPCTEDHCDTASGDCSNAANDELLCDDGSKCTTGDACVAGECLSGTEDACADGNPCMSNTCTDGECVNQLLHGEPCEDGDPCTVDDICALGACTSGEPNTCNDENDCTEDSCTSEEGCSHALGQDLPCEDGDLCTGNDSCDEEGACLSGPEVDCDDENPCTNETCDSALGCQITHVDAACDDGNACTDNDSCAEGICLGTELSCDDENACTQESCDTVSGCQHIDISAMCLDSNLCTDDSCDADLGCSYAPNQLSCDDELICTTNDRCDSGTCVGKVDNCDDEDPCTFDACDHEMGCINESFTGSCDDGNACTTESECNEEGVCGGGSDLDVDDSIECTFDGCDPDTGLFHVPDHDLCAMGQQCLPESGCVMGDNLLLLTKLALMPEEGLADAHGQWLALTNRGAEAVDLHGYGLKNAEGLVAPLSLPASESEASLLIAPGQTRAAIKATDTDDVVGGFSLLYGEFDDGFTFSSDGEEISLVDEHGEVADSLIFSPLTVGPDISLGTFPIEAGSVVEFDSDSAAQANDSAANDNPDLWCIWPQESATPEGPSLDCGAAVLNAITLASDNGERWLEIHQPAGGRLDGLTVHIVDHQGASLQQIAVAAGKMPMTRILMLKDGEADVSLPQLTDGSVQLLRDGLLVDVYGFGTLEGESDSIYGLPLFEGAVGAAQSPSIVARRVQAGVDSDDNSVDWTE